MTPQAFPQAPRAVFVVSLLLLSLGLCISVTEAFAADLDWAAVQCTPLVVLDSQIRYCTDNPKATLSALACSVQITAAWNAASKDVAEVEMAEQGGQRLDFGQSQEKYDLAVERLQKLIAVTKNNTDLIALYPTVMVDAPGISSFSDSLPCYKEIYDQVQHTVTQLDLKAAAGRKVLASVTRLRSNLKTLAEGVKSGIPAAHAAGLSQAGKLVSGGHFPAARQPAQSSDITGIREKTDLN